MSIQWRWTRSAINIPWQDRSRGERREDGEGMRSWTSRREGKKGEGGNGWEDRLNGLIHLCCFLSHYTQALQWPFLVQRDHCSAWWFTANRGQIQDAGSFSSPHITTIGTFVIVLCGWHTSLCINHDFKKREVMLCECSEWSTSVRIAL